MTTRLRFRYCPLLCTLLGFLTFCSPFVQGADEKATSNDLAGALQTLDPRVYPATGDKAKELPRILWRDTQARMHAANERETAAWQELKSRADWEKYRDARVRLLRDSLGEFPAQPKDLKVRVTHTLEGDGFRVENLVFESRPGLLVTANLYQPAKPGKGMPGILIIHSHHAPKVQGELRDMGMTWARQGCVVLVMDQVGHGERRQHPFRTEKDYPATFRPSRQDYYFRYNTAAQLHVTGESLMGWMVWDVMRGVDLLLARPGVDKDRILLLGAVAGGGDPAGVTAALDPRIAAVVPFNFGGPQPENYPLPENAEPGFNWFGDGYWESTRCLRLSARDGFSHFLIVGATAPRRLSYAHEFTWQRERDPAWARLQKVYQWYDRPDHLAFVAGKGTVKGTGPENSHCNNIGPLHRSQIYPSFKTWFDLPIPEEYTKRPPPEDLLCLTPEALKDGQPKSVHELAADLAAKQLAASRQRRAELKPEERRTQTRQTWTRLLGDVEPKVKVTVAERQVKEEGKITVERTALEVEPGMVVPLLLLRPMQKSGGKPAVVIGLAQEGKAGFLKHRSAALAELLDAGVVVCLPDLRGCGETKPGDGRGSRSSATSVSATEWMLGQTLLGSRLRDLRSVMQYLRGRDDLDAKRLALWGDSFAPVNAPDANLAVPLDAEKFPAVAEPAGGLLALLGALFEEDVRAVSVHGSLAGYASLLQSPFLYVPHDALVAGVLRESDVCDLAGEVAPRPLQLDGLVDGLNRKVSAEALATTYEPTRLAYRAADAAKRLQLESEETGKESATRWLIKQLKAE
jgi:dienelactone hydrolase